MKKLPTAALNLKQFLLRNEVLKLYRDIMRTIKQVPDAANQRELKDWARHDFLQNKTVTDEVAIKMLIQHGNRSLTELKNSLNLSGNTKTMK